MSQHKNGGGGVITCNPVIAIEPNGKQGKRERHIYCKSIDLEEMRHNICFVRLQNGGLRL
jgi:hypothetical protein